MLLPVLPGLYRPRNKSAGRIKSVAGAKREDKIGRERLNKQGLLAEMDESVVVVGA